ncbi:MAG: hypothetical protein G01um10148_818 [Parcubacteria group bacterium Gr01-1014_8]|nr:MAG: hypothetical protein G01um10148_818 [Parcubacteria group bacterium Gr01-1014_8]
MTDNGNFGGPDKNHTPDDTKRMIEEAVRRAQERLQKNLQRTVDQAGADVRKQDAEEKARTEETLKAPIEERVAYAAGAVMNYFYFTMGFQPDKAKRAQDSVSLISAAITTAQRASEDLFKTNPQGYKTPEEQIQRVTEMEEVISNTVLKWYERERDTLVASGHKPKGYASMEGAWATFVEGYRDSFNTYAFPKTKPSK